MNMTRMRPLVIAALVVTLAACGGGGASSVSTTKAIPGTVDSKYGAVGFSVLSGWAEAPAPVTGNSFSVDVSQSAPHVLIATDAGGSPRSYAIWIPGTSSVSFTASSTALALIFTTPRIYTNDPTAALQTLTAIHSLNSFPALETLFKGQESSSLQTLFGSTAVQSALANCLIEWFAAHPSRAAQPKSIISDHSNAPDRILLTYSDVNPSKTSVRLENSDFRFLEVCQRSVKGGSPPVCTRLSDLGGGGAIDIVNLLFGSIGEPSVQVPPTVDMSSTGSSHVEYYFKGIGRKTGIPLPPEVDQAFSGNSAFLNGLDTALIETIFWYGIVPLTDTLGGFADYLQYSSAWTDILNGIKDYPSIAQDIVDLNSALSIGTEDNIRHASGVLAVDMFSALDKKDLLKNLLLGYFKSQGLTEAKAIAHTATFLTASRQYFLLESVLAGAQFYAIVHDWQDWSQVNMWSLKVEGSADYSVQDIGTLGGHTFASGLNANGLVVGSSVASDGFTHAFLWDTGAMTDLKWFGGSDPSPIQSQALAINDSGKLVGFVAPSGQGQQGYVGISPIFIPVSVSIPISIWGVVPKAISSNGNIGGIVLFLQNGVSIGHAFTLKGNSFQDLDPQVGDIHGINDLGQVVATNGNGGFPSAVFYDPTQGVQKMYTGGGTSSANALSNTGYATGLYTTTSNPNDKQAFVWKGGVFTSLSPLDVNHVVGSVGRAVDDSGTVVGDAVNSSGDTVACMWKTGSTPKDINKLISLPGITLSSAVGINSHGQILCTASVNGTAHSYLLSPN
jgi:probable HAF family extracellular repeat protein